jgi:hypothetical protein
MEGFAAVASAVIALIALGVSIAVAVSQSRIAREQTTIQQRLAAIEEARRAEEVAARAEEAAARGQARVTASIRRGVAEDRLVLHNEGPALAHGVQVEIQSLDGDPLPTFDGIEVLPVDLQADQEMVFLILRVPANASTSRPRAEVHPGGAPHPVPDGRPGGVPARAGTSALTLAWRLRR